MTRRLLSSSPNPSLLLASLVILVLVIFTVAELKAQNAPDKEVAAEIDPVGPPDLISASRNGDLEAIRESLEAGFDINHPDPIHGITPLSWAAALGHMEAVALLLREGADMDARNQNGSSALHTACFFGQPEVVEQLVNSGADVNVEMPDGERPLDVIKADWETTRDIANALDIDFDEHFSPK